MEVVVPLATKPKLAPGNYGELVSAMKKVRTYVHVNVQSCVYVRTYVCSIMYLRMLIYVHNMYVLNVYTYIYLDIKVCVYVYFDMHTYVRTYYMYVCTYTYVFTVHEHTGCKYVHECIPGCSTFIIFGCMYSTYVVLYVHWSDCYTS